MEGEIMEEKLVPVTNYHLSSDNLKVEFVIKDKDKLILVYEDKNGRREFSGRQIYREKTRLGFFPSVDLKVVPDSHTIAFSLMVPAANRPANAKSISVRTFAVRTRIQTTIGGPGLVEGQIETYKTYDLKGNAW